VEKNVHFLAFLAYFWHFLQILPQLKTFFPKNLSARIKLVLDATFLPSLTFLGIFISEISRVEKPVTHSPRHPTYFAIREPQCCALKKKQAF